MKNDYLGHKKLKKFQVLFYSRVVSSWAFSAEITEQGLDVFYLINLGFFLNI